MSKEMSVKDDLRCTFNMPEKLGSQFDGNEEEQHGLPPFAPVDVYPVDEYEACPSNWMHGSDMVSSYFVGIKEDHGMWLDFNECFYHTHDVAVVISVQGINPITGQKMVAEKALQLEQYHKKCPIHSVNFKQERYCEKCGFKWPGQNYLATTGTPEMMLWLDGFRTPEGKVRQYIFTEDKVRGVASQLIGEERVFAIGIAYYLSKNKKPYTLQRPQEEKFMPQDEFAFPIHDCHNYMGDRTLYCESLYTPDIRNDKDIITTNADVSEGSEADQVPFLGGISAGLSPGGQSASTGSISINSFAKRRKASASITSVKKFEIGAGALIGQRVYDDPKMMSYWESEPAGMIYINYCDEVTKKKILDGGRRADEKDGFLQNIKVGG